jgi:hypothetical protein
LHERLRKDEKIVEQTQNGRFFRNAWIAGVKQHYPETPKEGYIAPWEAISSWEQESASAVYEQVYQFVTLSGGKTTHLSREQKGRFICLCWIVQIFKHISNPKPSYVADWDELPTWQRETDADIFEAIEKFVLQNVA